MRSRGQLPPGLAVSSALLTTRVGPSPRLGREDVPFLSVTGLLVPVDTSGHDVVLLAVQSVPDLVEVDVRAGRGIDVEGGHAREVLSPTEARDVDAEVGLS